MSDAPRLLIIVPAFNEAASIAGVLDELRHGVPGADIAVIDDGSTDDTARIVAQQARQHAGRVRLLCLPFNLGIGGAVQTGYRLAHREGYDLAVQVDADGQHPAEGVADLVRQLRSTGCDLVIGSRFLRPGDYRQSASRMIGIRFLRGLIRLLAGQRFSDPTSGFRAAGPRAIAAFARWYPDDYPEPEVVLLLIRAGYHVAEVPTRMRQRTAGQTSIPLHRGLFYVVKVTLALILDLLREPWPRPTPTPKPDPDRRDQPSTPNP